MEASTTRGSIGRASYEAVRKHIDDGKKATQAFKLVAQETGRSAATVQTAYYRIARSLPDGGGVPPRPRSKNAAPKRKGERIAAASTTATRPAARRGRPPRSGSSTSVAVLARQLSTATEALVAHIARLEGELASARKDRQRLHQIERVIGR
jgi:hypothetical protein